MDNLAEFRQQKDYFFAHDPHSPLSQEQRDRFSGLNYYPENSSLVFSVELEPAADQEVIQMHTSTGEMEDYFRVGKFRFEVDGQEAELTVFASQDGEGFIPFRDATSGDETYGAGRYLEIEDLGEGRYLVDFNLAYNPWCAYSPYYSCPIPPDENRLQVPIRAGEKSF